MEVDLLTIRRAVKSILKKKSIHYYIIRMNYYCLIDIWPCLFSDYTTGETSAERDREIEGSKREERSSGYDHELVCVTV